MARRVGDDLRQYLIPAMPAYLSEDGARLAGFDYLYQIGFVLATASWREEGSTSAFYNARRTTLPLLGEPVPNSVLEDAEK